MVSAVDVRTAMPIRCAAPGRCKVRGLTVARYHAAVARGRLEYLDALRLALTVLVVVHHALISYGAAGGWFYIEPNDWPRWSLTGSVITALNQLYFMGLFFLVAGYFTPAALARKGTARFLVDRA